LKATQSLNAQRFIVATDSGILYKMQQASPERLHRGAWPLRNWRSKLHRPAWCQSTCRNSLLECLVFGKSAAAYIAAVISPDDEKPPAPEWDDSRVANSREEFLLLHNWWDEICHVMWNYVGIVRSNERLVRAERRIRLLKEEIQDYYSRHRVNRNFIELCHLVVVAEQIVKAALTRKQSVGLHYNIDYEQIKPA